MGVVERVRNLLKADLEEMRFRKDAAATVRRYLRDLEWSHRELVEATRRAQTTRNYLQDQIAHNRECCQRWSDRAELALRHEDEPLARIALTRKQTDLAQSTQIAGQLENCIREQRELAEQLNHLQERILAVRYLRPASASDSAAGASATPSEVERELATLKRNMGRSKKVRKA